MLHFPGSFLARRVHRQAAESLAASLYFCCLSPSLQFRYRGVPRCPSQTRNGVRLDSVLERKFVPFSRLRLLLWAQRSRRDCRTRVQQAAEFPSLKRNWGRSHFVGRLYWYRPTWDTLLE